MNPLLKEPELAGLTTVAETPFGTFRIQFHTIGEYGGVFFKIQTKGPFGWRTLKSYLDRNQVQRAMQELASIK